MTSHNHGCVQQVRAPQEGPADLDIIFFQGLHKHWKPGWNNGRDGDSWIEDMLPLAVRKARIFACGYDVLHCRPDANTNCIELASKSYLAQVEEHQKHAQVPSILVAHSLGGLVLQSLLMQALSANHAILASIARIYFLGVPLGLDLQPSSFSLFISKVQRALRSPPTSVAGLDHLVSIPKSFAERYPSSKLAQKSSVNIHCWYETLESSSLGIVLDQKSAVLGGSSSRPVHADHIGLCSFADPLDMSFQTFCCDLCGLLSRPLPKAVLPRDSILPLQLLDFMDHRNSIAGYYGNQSEVVRQMVGTGTFLNDEGQYDTAAKWLLRADRILRDEGSLYHPIGWFAQDKLAEIRQNQAHQALAQQDPDQQSQGRRILHNAACSCQDALSKDPIAPQRSPEKTSLRLRLVSILLSMHKPNEAVRELHTTFEGEALVTDNAINFARLQALFAKLCEISNQFQMAELYLRNTLRCCTSFLRRAHPFTGQQMLALAGVYFKQESWSLAHGFAKQAYSTLRACLRFDHPECVSCLTFLGITCMFATTFEEGRDYLQESLDLQTQTHPQEPGDKSLSEHILRAFNKETLEESLLNASNIVQLLKEHPEYHLPSGGMDEVANGGKNRVDSGFSDGPDSHPSKFEPEKSFRSLLKYYGRPSARSSLYGSRVLTCAFFGEDAELADHISKSGKAAVNAQGGIFYSSLHAAIIGNQESTVRLLLSHNVETEPSNGTSCSPLELACTLRRYRIVNLLLRHKVNPNVPDPLFGSAFSYALATSQEDVVRLLLEQKVNPNAGNGFAGTPIETTVWAQNGRLTELILQQGAFFRLPHELLPAYFAAKAQGKQDVMELLNDKAIELYDVDLAHESDSADKNWNVADSDSGEDKDSSLSEHVAYDSLGLTKEQRQEKIVADPTLDRADDGNSEDSRSSSTTSAESHDDSTSAVPAVGGRGHRYPELQAIENGHTSLDRRPAVTNRTTKIKPQMSKVGNGGSFEDSTGSEHESFRTSLKRGSDKLRKTFTIRRPN